MSDRRIGEPADRELGTRRARAAALLTFSLPGAVYLYQGDELGLWEVEDIPDELLQDPFWERSGHTDRGRDGCRVPLPWSGKQPPFGFGPEGSVPWLPQPTQWKDLTAETESGDEGSMLELYRAALRLRHEEPAFASGEMRWLDSPADVLSYRRGDDITVVINLSAHAVGLPAHSGVLISSASVVGGMLAPDCAAWLSTR
jgi:alpha-glucosidase